MPVLPCPCPCVPQRPKQLLPHRTPVAAKQGRLQEDSLGSPPSWLRRIALAALPAQTSLAALTCKVDSWAVNHAAEEAAARAKAGPAPLRDFLSFLHTDASQVG